jgi:hypothetical protein
LAANHQHRHHDRHGRGDADGDVDDARMSFQSPARKVGDRGVDGGPEDAACGVGRQELAPAHLAGAGQERGVGAQNRNEPAEEHHHDAVPVEQVASDLELALIKADPAALRAGEPVAALDADPVPDVVPDDRRRGGHDEDQPRGQLVSRPGVGTGQNQRRLTGQGDAQAFHADQDEQRGIAVRVDEMADAHTRGPAR